MAAYRREVYPPVNRVPYDTEGRLIAMDLEKANDRDTSRYYDHCSASPGAHASRINGLPDRGRAILLCRCRPAI